MALSFSHYTSKLNNSQNEVKNTAIFTPLIIFPFTKILNKERLEQQLAEVEQRLMNSVWRNQRTKLYRKKVEILKQLISSEPGNMLLWHSLLDALIVLESPVEIISPVLEQTIRWGRWYKKTEIVSAYPCLKYWPSLLNGKKSLCAKNIQGLVNNRDLKYIYENAGLNRVEFDLILKQTHEVL